MYEMIPRDFLNCKQHAGNKYYIVGKRFSMTMKGFPTHRYQRISNWSRKKTTWRCAISLSPQPQGCMSAFTHSSPCWGETQAARHSPSDFCDTSALKSKTWFSGLSTYSWMKWLKDQRIKPNDPLTSFPVNTSPQPIKQSLLTIPLASDCVCGR